MKNCKWIIAIKIIVNEKLQMDTFSFTIIYLQLSIYNFFLQLRIYSYLFTNIHAIINLQLFICNNPFTFFPIAMHLQLFIYNYSFTTTIRLQKFIYSRLLLSALIN